MKSWYLAINVKTCNPFSLHVQKGYSAPWFNRKCSVTIPNRNQAKIGLKYEYTYKMLVHQYEKSE